MNTKNVEETRTAFVGIDDGHSDVKVVLEDGCVFKFPTRIAHGGFVADFPGMETATTVYAVVDDANRETLYTTHQFLQDTECIDIRFDGYPKSDMNLVVVQNALVNAGFSDKEVIIATGLPVQNHYTADGHINTELVADKVKNLQRQVKPSGQAMAKIVKSYVTTEAIATFIDAIMTMDGKKSELYDRLTREIVAVLDIGGKTTDFAVLYEGGKIVDKKRLGSLTLGILELKDEISNYLRQHYKLSSIGIRHVESLLNTGKFRYGGKEYDLSQELSSMKEKFVRRIFDSLDRKLGDLGDVDAILCTGGGAALLREQLLSKYEGQAVIVDEPEFSNARGMLKTAKFIMKGV
ncbi:ParM/StbA family protein [Neisseria elongata]|jgi:stbA family protein|uniref:ParM/StbA family protein n=1 Tax=Neisseria elongata TaxID=495 RepID=UPI000D32157A|nr:ParM/StbA family protein [Neisseria elongata]